MPTIAIVGAGPGLGRSIATRFGAEGFTVALLSRSREKLDRLTAELGQKGVVARGFPADVTDPPGLTGALVAAERHFGSLDVLEFSPAPPDPSQAGLAPVDAVDMTVASVQPQLDYYLFGGITAVQAVLPGMRRRGSGTILVSTGASSGPVVHPPFANIAAATGALRNWVLNLHTALAPEGIHAAHVAISAWIGQGGPQSDPDVIADAYWDLHHRRDQAELFYRDEALTQ